MAEVLRLANILDKMSELVEMVAPHIWRRVSHARWYRHLYRQVAQAVRTG
jgi:hypothetical protein